MRLIFLSGLSGSGKSVALHMLEDLGVLLHRQHPGRAAQALHLAHRAQRLGASISAPPIGIDARNPDDEIATVPMLLDELKRSGIQL